MNARTMPRPRIVAVVLAYNCARMLARAHGRIPKDLVDGIFVMDDGSTDDTFEAARVLGLTVFRHGQNRGYGGNLKEGLRRASEAGADYVLEVHGDGAQFNPQALRVSLDAMQRGAQLILGSRFEEPKRALENGMPIIRFVANRLLSIVDRLVLRLPLADFHTGFRVYGRRLLENVPYDENSNDYLFSFQIIAQAAYYRMPVAQVPVDADYNSEHTSQPMGAAIVYAIQTFWTLGQYLLAVSGLRYNRIFQRR